MNDLDAMAVAITVAKIGVTRGHRPYGAVVYRGDRVLSAAYGTESSTDPTRHSEILAIQRACIRVDGLLGDCTLVSTHQPCHMCCGAIKHAKVGRVVWGSYRSDLPELFRQCAVPSRGLLIDTSTPPEIVTGVLRLECIGLFEDELREHYEAVRRNPEDPPAGGVRRGSPRARVPHALRPGHRGA